MVAGGVHIFLSGDDTPVERWEGTACIEFGDEENHEDSMSK